MKLFKLFVCLFVLFLISFPGSKALAQVSKQNSTTINFYWSSTCNYCLEGKSFLEGYKLDNKDADIQYFEVTSDKNNALKLQKLAGELNFNANSVPATIVGNQVIVGFEKERYKTLLEDALKNPQEKKVQTVSEKSNCDLTSEVCTNDNIVNLPLFGKVNLSKYSLFGATVILGLADGFNPCAMWALLALIGILLALKDHKKLIIIGGAFILASYGIYFIYLSAWLNVFLYIGYVKIIQILIGIISVVIGVNYVRIFLKTDPATCKVVDGRKKNKLIKKFERLINHNFLPFAIIGIILLAISVNTIEIICSVGIPTIYTKLLSSANITGSKYYSYIAGYNVFYMADDIIVFTLAVLTKRIVQPSPKFGYWSRLVGGLLLFALGLIFIFKPEALSL